MSVLEKLRQIRLKTLLQTLILTITAGYFGKLYQLVDQSFASHISPEALRTHVFVSYLPFGLNLLCIGIGFSVIVLLSKQNEVERKRTFTGATILASTIGFALVCGVILFKAPILEVSGLSRIPGAAVYLLIQSIASLLVPFNTVSKYASLAKKKPIHILSADGVGTTVNLLGNAASFVFLESNEAKIVLVQREQERCLMS